GTTKKGIGPAYMDKAARTGIRIADLLDKDNFREKLEQNLEEKNRLFEKVYECESMQVEDILEEYYEYGQQMKQFVCDTSVVLKEALDSGRRVLFEGAQGVMLDLDQGTYPFVTSSNPVAGGVTIGAGVGPSKISTVVGVSKAYTTRVGDGPFPTELSDEIGDQIREVGREYGTTTGRPRRVGWFDCLTGIETLKICVAYRYRGEVIREFPANLNALAECEAIYEELPGWNEDITDVTSLDDLPVNARHYLERISQLTEIPLSIFSVGPDRTQTNIVQSVYR